MYLTDEGSEGAHQGVGAPQGIRGTNTVVMGRRVGRWALPSIQATLLARHLRGDLPAYPPFVMT